jgi:hypothetical protein
MPGRLEHRTESLVRLPPEAAWLGTAKRAGWTFSWPPGPPTTPLRECADMVELVVAGLDALVWSGWTKPHTPIPFSARAGWTHPRPGPTPRDAPEAASDEAPPPPG